MKKNYLYHDYHLVRQSPWPFLVSISLLSLTLSLALYFNDYKNSLYMLLYSIGFLCFLLSLWFRDVIREAQHFQLYTKRVVLGLRYGFILFIISEVMFFFGFFWAYFHSSLNPSIEIGSLWPPFGLDVINLVFPTVNTIILLTSGCTITVAHLLLLKILKEEELRTRDQEIKLEMIKQIEENELQEEELIEEENELQEEELIEEENELQEEELIEEENELQEEDIIKETMNIIKEKLDSLEEKVEEKFLSYGQISPIEERNDLSIVEDMLITTKHLINKTYNPANYLVEYDLLLKLYNIEEIKIKEMYKQFFGIEMPINIDAENNQYEVPFNVQYRLDELNRYINGEYYREKLNIQKNGINIDLNLIQKGFDFYNYVIERQEIIRKWCDDFESDTHDIEAFLSLYIELTMIRENMIDEILNLSDDDLLIFQSHYYKTNTLKFENNFEDINYKKIPASLADDTFAMSESIICFQLALFSVYTNFLIMQKEFIEYMQIDNYRKELYAHGIQDVVASIKINEKIALEARRRDQEIDLEMIKQIEENELQEEELIEEENELQEEELIEEENELQEEELIEEENKWVKNHLFDTKSMLILLFSTISLALLFTAIQLYEYINAPFSISDGIFGSCFFMLTGFHGIHVLVGTIFILVQTIRVIKNHFEIGSHLGFEASIWYWHFVDIIWLLLYFIVYIWVSFS